MTLPCDSTWPEVYHDVECLFFFLTFSTHSSCILHACCFFFSFKMMLYDFLAISIWNVFVKWIIIIVVKSISFGSKIHLTLYLNVLLITNVEYRQGSPFKESVGGLTLFRSHLSKFLSSWGTISQVYICSKPSSFYLFALGPLLK